MGRAAMEGGGIPAERRARKERSGKERGKGYKVSWVSSQVLDDPTQQAEGGWREVEDAMKKGRKGFGERGNAPPPRPIPRPAGTPFPGPRGSCSREQIKNVSARALES